MKRFLLTFAIILSVGLLTISIGIAGPDDAKEIAVFSSRGDISELTPEQIAARDKVGNYMDRYLIQGLERQKFNALLLDTKEDKAKTAYLLEVTIQDLYEVPRAARFWGGRMAGANKLNLHYDFFDPKGNNILSWDDGVGSTKSSNHCAQALNKKTVKKIAAYFKENK